jgi:hypothetical protein
MIQAWWYYVTSAIMIVIIIYLVLKEDNTRQAKEEWQGKYVEKVNEKQEVIEKLKETIEDALRSTEVSKVAVEWAQDSRVANDALLQAVLPLVEKTDWMTGRWGGQFQTLVNMEDARNAQVACVQSAIGQLPAVKELMKDSASVLPLVAGSAESAAKGLTSVGVPEGQKIEFAKEGGVQRVSRPTDPDDGPDEEDSSYPFQDGGPVDSPANPTMAYLR